MCAGYLECNDMQHCCHDDDDTHGPSWDGEEVRHAQCFICYRHCRIIDAPSPSQSPRNKGVIVNVSSGFGRYPGAFLAVYSATKSYADFFSRALAREYASKGIIIQVSHYCMCSGSCLQGALFMSVCPCSVPVSSS